MSFKRFFSGVLSLALVLGLSVSARAKGVDRSLLSISGGGSHSACVTQEGQVYAWGSNRALQLGIEDQVDSAAPTEVDGVHAISVACGYDFTAALSFGGTVYTWGFQQDRLPRELSLTGVTKIDAGQTDILALRTDGTVWQWAYGGEPRRVAGLSRVADISAGGGHCLALTVDGCVYAWGGNDYGQLGDGTREPRFAPVRVKNLSGAVRVAAGNGCSMALNDAGSVYTWGCGEYGQLGNGTNTVAADSPIKVAGLSDVAQIECGVYHCMAVTNGGVLYMWGRNRDGQVWSDLSGSCTTPRKLRGELDTDSAVQLNPVSGASAWAEAELSELYETDAAFPMLWDRFGARITRAEFTALLVSVYESRKNTTVHENATAKFTDVAGHPLESELRKAITLGLVNGTSDTTIEPDRALTRQEGAKILCSFISRTQGVTIPKKLQNLSFYADATLIQPWAAPYVYYAYENKIMRGRTDGCFDPNGGLTREQSLLMAQRVLAMYGSK